MAFINIAEWTAVNTTDWLKGLDDCILPYVQFFLNNNINGCRLLLLSCDDLNNLNVRKVGHQELILDAVDLLKHLHYSFGSETLQALALRLGCKARSLFNQLKQNQTHSQNNNNNDESLDHNYNSEERVSTQTLSAVSDILAAVKAFISWIDRYPFEGQEEYIPVRKTILKLSIELASTAQRDQFVEKPNDVIKKSCITLAELCDRIVQELNDSLAIQPAVLDIVTVKKKPDEELGMHIHSSYSGIHIVGGVKFQSPSHRCGRIEEGDEIVQVSYQTVVGWQLKKLVNSMREHPTEIILTIKKRPRHSNLTGQVIVLKPYKIPARKSGRDRQQSRVKNAATTTVGSDGDDDAFLPNDNKTASKPVYQLYPRKPKLPVRRRATISGSSPTVCQPPIRIEDLVSNMDKKESFNRSISHESSNKPVLSRSRGLSVPVPVPSPSVPLTVCKNKNNNNQMNYNNNSSNKMTVNNNNIINSNNSNSNTNNNNCVNKPLCSYSPKLPYAKVHPFPNEDQKYIRKSENETTPKKIMSSKESDSMSKEHRKSIASEDNDLKHNLKFISQDEEHSLLEQKRMSGQMGTQTPTQVGVVNPSPVTVKSYQLISDIQPKSASNMNESKEKANKMNRLLKSPLLLRRAAKELSKSVDNQSRSGSIEPEQLPNTPILRTHNSKTRLSHSTRRVSCKDLGEGDCQGWLYQRKERQHGFLGSSSRWTKRWVVLKTNYLYCYKDQNEVKAECLIHLPGFTVSPAQECKSKKYAFKLFNPQMAFHFASDNQPDMSAWMNKMGLAAISYMTHNDLLPEAFTYSETDESEEGVSPSLHSHRNQYLLSSKPGSYREASPAALSTSSSDTNNSIKDELYGRSRITSTSSTSSTTTSNSSTFHDILPKHKSQNHSYQHQNSVGAIPTHSSPLVQRRMGYVRSASSLEANDVIAARNRRQLLTDLSNTRYAKIVFPQSQSPKGSYSPQIPPRRLRINSNSSGFNADSSSLDRQRLNFLKDITSGTVSKMANSYNSLQEDPTTPLPLPKVAARQIQPPRSLPRTSKTVNRRENVLPGFVAKMTDNFDHKLNDSKIPSVPNTPPIRPAVPKPTEKFNGFRNEPKQVSEQQNPQEDAYEYVFRPTMAMIKTTGIVNPLYERVLNSSWSSGDMPVQSLQPTGKSRMPLPNELKPESPQTQNVSEDSNPVPTKNDKQSPNELSILDREYNRLYGVKKPNERLSPKIPVLPYLPKSATTAEIENIYTSHPRTTSSSSIGHFDDMPSPGVRGSDRPNTPSSSDNSMSSSSGISSYYSTYLEIPAEQMHRIMNNKRQNTSTSSYHSAKSTSPTDKSFEEQKNQKLANGSHPSNESSADGSNKANKSPTKSSSFRLFSSPKLLKKLSTPKYHKERNLEKQKGPTIDDIQKPNPIPVTQTTKTSRLFLGSPKLTRALFGGSDGSSSSSSSKKNQSKPVPMPSPPQPAQSAQDNSQLSLNCCDNKSIDSITSCQTSDESLYNMRLTLNGSSSDSSLQSGSAGPKPTQHHIIEKRLTKPQLTIQLPLLTESSTDSSEMPLTPETPRKPTMGIAMIGKKRRPSQVGSEKGDIESALQQYYGSCGGGSGHNASTCSSRTDYTTEDTDDEWANIVRTIEESGRTLESDNAKTEHNPSRALASKPIDDEKLCHLVLSLRSMQRTLKPEQYREYDAIDDLLNQPISAELLDHWIKKYPHLLPQEYY